MPQANNNSNLPTKPNGEERRNRLVDLILKDDKQTPISDLAIEAGYAESYAKTHVYDLMASETFKSQLLKKAKAYELARVPRIIKLADNALKQYEKDTRLVIEKPTLYQSMRKDLELSKPEETTGNTYIAINTLQQLVATGNQAQDTQEAKVIDED